MYIQNKEKAAHMKQLHTKCPNKIAWFPLTAPLLGMFQTLCIITNLYNGDFVPLLGHSIEYATGDALCLLLLLVAQISQRDCIPAIAWCLHSLCLILHLQWALHDPWDDWPEWMVGTKSISDARHRTEFYDTSVACFAMHLTTLTELMHRTSKNQTNLTPQLGFDDAESPS